MGSEATRDDSVKFGFNEAQSSVFAFTIPLLSQICLFFAL